MNVCMKGHCICDAQEWEGDTYCAAYYGNEPEPEVLEDRRTGPPAYFFDYDIPGSVHGVCLSVDPSEREPGVKYFQDPGLTIPYQEE